MKLAIHFFLRLFYYLISREQLYIELFVTSPTSHFEFSLFSMLSRLSYLTPGFFWHRVSSAVRRPVSSSCLFCTEVSFENDIGGYR